ncbi:hypothetical protein ACTA71_012679 [Dictyostelium dimigraforme]
MEFNFNSNYPILESEGLILKRITKEHVDSLFLMRSDPMSMNFVPRPLAKTKEDVLEWIEQSDKLTESNDFVNFGVFLKENPNVAIGIIGFVRMNKANHRGEIGYISHSIHHRKGYTFEALKLVVDFGFNIMNFHTIEACIDPLNEPSINLIKKTGFNLEAQFKENFFHPILKEFRDTNVYCKINPNHIKN